MPPDQEKLVPSPAETEVRAAEPAVEVAVSPPQEVGTETRATMTESARARYGALPAPERSVFAAIRETLRVWKNPVEAARAYRTRQLELSGRADAKVVRLSEEQGQAATTAKERQAVIVRESQALTQAEETLRASGLQGKALERALASAKKAADREIGRASIDAGNADHRAKVLEDRIRVAKDGKARLEQARERAQTQLDDAVMRGMNRNLERAGKVDAKIAAFDGQMNALNERIGELDATIANFSAKAEQFKGTAVKKTFDELVEKAQGERDKLVGKVATLERKKAPWNGERATIDRDNEGLAGNLSDAKVDTLLKQDRTRFIGSLLSVEQLKQVGRDQVVLLLHKEDDRANLIKKLDAAGRLDEFQDVVGTREALVGQGILEAPNAQKEVEEPVPEEATLGVWKDALKRGSDLLDITLPEGLDDFPLTRSDLMGVAYDQSVAVVDKRLQKGALKLLVDFVKKVFGEVFKAEEGVEAMHKGPRRKIDEAIVDWNKIGIGPTLTPPTELKGREMSEGTLKLELARLVQEQGGDVAKVSEFMAREAAPAAPEAAAA